MVAPTKSWKLIADTDVDADSPVNETLMTNIRDDLYHLEEWLGKDYTAAQNHDHDGTNSKAVASVGAGAVNQGALKTTTGEVSVTESTGLNLTLPGGEYGFYPQLKSQNLSNSDVQTLMEGQASTSYVTNIYLEAAFVGGGENCYAQQRYVQSSPPYMIGSEQWGHFFFQLVNSAGDVKATYEAPDAPWGNNGALWVSKDDPERIASLPHPFANYINRNPADDGLEIVLVDMRGVDVETIRTGAMKGRRHFTDEMVKAAKGKTKNKKMADTGLPMITGFTDRVKIKE